MRRVVALALEVALAVAAPTARADWISLGTPNPPPGHVDGLTWALAGMMATGAVLPQVVAGVELASDKRVIETKGAVALAVPGVLLGGATMVGLGLVDATDEATLLVLLGGPLASMGGIGLARLVSPAPRATFLGGSLGFSAFAAQHGVLAQLGFADRPSMAALQALFGATGGVGCFVQATGATGAEKVAGLGCAAVGAAAFVHGLVRMAYGEVSRPPRPARSKGLDARLGPGVVPGGASVAVTGTF